MDFEAIFLSFRLNSSTNREINFSKHSLLKETVVLKIVFPKDRSKSGKKCAFKSALLLKAHFFGPTSFLWTTKLKCTFLAYFFKKCTRPRTWNGKKSALFPKPPAQPPVFAKAHFFVAFQVTQQSTRSWTSSTFQSALSTPIWNDPQGNRQHQRDPLQSMTEIIKRLDDFISKNVFNH